ncbi:alpha-L-fucosidase [Microlunatus ginsengisoli]|uniref:alpha-L-fucosidase n=1 Tax=Microlunatus ginsengisoli TaxID=363863 RepID=A0ABP7AJS5_9ACTN
MSSTASGADLASFTHDRLGMFIHFGLYALAGRHEWVQNFERIAPEDYLRYFEHFDPDLFDAADWARRCKRAGMRYAVLTTKHHEGFCLWDTEFTDYKITNTPFGRDLVAEFVAAFRAEGIKIGFYHSLLDWHHPDFTIDGHHPLRDRPDVAELNAGRDMARYREYLHRQVRELLTGYGEICYLFYDFSYPAHLQPAIWGNKTTADWAGEELLAMTRELQPGIVVNDRLGIPGDLVTPEQYQPAEPMRQAGRPDGELVAWEACQTINGSWGYFRDNTLFKTPEMLVRMLVDGVSKGGNLLFNIGPTGRGNFDPVSAQILAELGEWMDLHARSVIGAGPSDFVAPVDARYTQRGNRLYLHLFAWPFEYVHLPGLAGRVAYAQLLNDASEIAMSTIDPDAPAHNVSMGGLPAGTLTLKLPIRQPAVAVPVVELFLT